MFFTAFGGFLVFMTLFPLFLLMLCSFCGVFRRRPVSVCVNTCAICGARYTEAGDDILVFRWRTVALHFHNFILYSYIIYYLYTHSLYYLYIPP